MPSDTSKWPEIKLGFHSFRSPPDFAEPEVTAVVGTASVHILQNRTDKVVDIVRSQSDVGQIVSHHTVGKWEVFVTREDSGLVVSSYTFLVFGVQRVGSDVVLTRDSMSRTDFPNGDDASRWLFHSLTAVRPLTERRGASGFVIGDVFFETRYFEQRRPEIEARFTANSALTSGDDGNGPQSRTTNSYSLTFSITQHDDSDITEQPASSPDISTVPGVSVENRQLKVDNADAGFSRVTYDADGEEGTWFESAIFWFPGNKQIEPGTLLTSAHLKFANEAQPDPEAENRALGLLSSIKWER